MNNYNKIKENIIYDKIYLTRDIDTDNYLWCQDTINDDDLIFINSDYILNLLNIGITNATDSIKPIIKELKMKLISKIKEHD